MFNHTYASAVVSKVDYSSYVFRSTAQQPVCIQRPVSSQGLTYRSSAINKFQSKLLEMETGTLNEGLSRTQLTKDRLDVALSVLLTKEV